MATNPETAPSSQCTPPSRSHLLIDSGASVSIFNHKKWFVSLDNSSERLTVFDGTPAQSSRGKGLVQVGIRDVWGEQHVVVIAAARYVPECVQNIVSMSAMCVAGAQISENKRFGSVCFVEAQLEVPIWIDGRGVWMEGMSVGCSAPVSGAPTHSAPTPKVQQVSTTVQATASTAKGTTQPQTVDKAIPVVAAKPVPEVQAVPINDKNQASLWHKRLGHIGLTRYQQTE